jgi:adenosylmethionine-8-amino-7-oxononanoate aminotransferase
MARVQPLFVGEGVWVRPFGRLVYLMPPFVISDDELAALTAALSRVVAKLTVSAGSCVPRD